MKLPRRIRGAYKAFRILQNVIQAHRITHRSEDEKREYLARWVDRSGVRIFVETGTYLGRTVQFMARRVELCHTIELSESLHEAARSSLAEHRNIHLHHGDSAIVLPKLLQQIDEPALFWLDAHYSGGRTAGVGKNAPIEIELEAILSHGVQNHIVMIDDAREFICMKGYPTIKRLRKLVSGSGSGYKMIINNDIIVIYREEI